jgi:hypothetical protein
MIVKEAEAGHYSEPAANPRHYRATINTARLKIMTTTRRHPNPGDTLIV